MALAALLTAAAVWWLTPPRLDAGYFPIGVGYRWVYESIQPRFDEASRTVVEAKNEVVFEVVGVEKLGGAECYVVTRTIGDHRLEFAVEVAAEGVLIHRVGGDRYRPPYLQFRFGAGLGDRWDWDGVIGAAPEQYRCLVQRREQVKTPLGGWRAFCVNQNARQAGANTDFWLADGVGVVWLDSKGRDHHDPPPKPGESNRFDWRLKEFARPAR